MKTANLTIIGMFLLFSISIPVAYSSNINPDQIIIGKKGSLFGVAIISGDFNGDGIKDIIGGAEDAKYLGYPSGGTHIVYGGNSNEVINLSNEGVNIYGPNSFDSVFDKFGTVLASGDLNNDGKDDIMISALQASSPGSTQFAGAVYVVFGSNYQPGSVLDLNTIRPDITILGAGNPDGLGRGLAIGDVNGDGLGDMIIGATRRGLRLTGEGRFYIFYGRNWLSGTVIDLQQDLPDVTIKGLPNDNLGFSAVSGDINFDGYDDIVLGAATARNLEGLQSGAVYIVFGRNFNENEFISLDQPDSSLKIYGQKNADRFGASIALGQINHGKYADIVIGADQATIIADRPISGAVYVFYGTNYTNSVLEISKSAQDITIIGNEQFGSLGASVATGYINNDKLSDILIGADKESSTDNAVVIFSDNYDKSTIIDLANSEEDISIDRINNAIGFGKNVFSADVDNDGLDDILIAAPSATYAGTPDGTIFVVYGKNFATFNPADRPLPAQAQKPGSFNTISQFFDNLLSGFFVFVFKR